MRRIDNEKEISEIDKYNTMREDDVIKIKVVFKLSNKGKKEIVLEDVRRITSKINMFGSNKAKHTTC
mgnify:CR=1 FL=1